jgi:hypothetical protein
MAYREIKNECLGGGGRTTVSSYEAVRGWIGCSACGKILNIRANRENEAGVPRHSRKDDRKATLCVKNLFR